MNRRFLRLAAAVAVAIATTVTTPSVARAEMPGDDGGPGCPTFCLGSWAVCTFVPGIGSYCNAAYEGCMMGCRIAQAQ